MDDINRLDGDDVKASGIGAQLLCSRSAYYEGITGAHFETTLKVFYGDIGEFKL